MGKYSKELGKKFCKRGDNYGIFSNMGKYFEVGDIFLKFGECVSTWGYI